MKDTQVSLKLLLKTYFQFVPEKFSSHKSNWEVIDPEASNFSARLHLKITLSKVETFPKLTILAFQIKLEIFSAFSP